MASQVLASVVLVLMLLGCEAAANKKQADKRDIESLRALFAERSKEEVRSLEEPESKRGMFGLGGCKGRTESCSATSQCCSGVHCYYYNGFSLRSYGVCVDCIASGLICQRNVQCCGGFICHKTNRANIDGACGAKRASGSECHDDDQCISNSCNIAWYNKIRGSGGTCN